MFASVLLGRETERRELGGLLDAARSGESAILVLVGEPGIGKSSLLEAAAEQAVGMRVLRARGVEAEGEVPFAGLLELLRPALDTLPRVPALQARALESALALRPGRAYDRFAVGAATLGLLAAYADNAPLLLLVDDAQWLDSASAEALLFALRRLLADPIAAVLAVREGEPSPFGAADLPVRRLGGLEREASRALLDGLPDELADRLHTATAGNPLALLELRNDAEIVAMLPPDAPVPVSAHIAKAFLRRYGALSEGTRQSLLLAAASDSGDVAILTRAGLAIDDLAEAEREGLVEMRAGSVWFRHPLARSALYSDAAPDARRAAHRALAGVLPDRDADRRAWHLAAAAPGLDKTAAAALEAAGRRARGRSAYAVASAEFERAGRLDPDDLRRGMLLYEAADAAWFAGGIDRARALLGEAGRLGDDPRIVALTGKIATRAGAVVEGSALLLSAAERSPASEAILMLAEAADACFYSGAADKMLEVAGRAQMLVGADPAAPFYAAIIRGAALVVAGGDGAPDLRRALELYDPATVGDDPRSLAWAAMGPLFLREARGRELMSRAIDAARERAAMGVLPGLLNRIARDEAATNRWPDAEADFGEAIRLARETGQRSDLTAALAGLAWLEARQGRDAVCREHAMEARALALEHGLGFFELWTYSALGELELGAGRATRAIAELEAHERRARALAFEDVDMSTSPELVDAYLRVGRTDDAQRSAARYECAAREKGQPWALARAERSLALLAGDDFSHHFETALELHADTPDVFELARTRLAYGMRLRRARQRKKARAELLAALELFDSLGPTPWADTAGVELAATGITARRRDPSTLGDLTAQELQIALLLASGKTTREAAAALFLSPKTIEYHLRSVYRKLGVNSRDALARALQLDPPDRP